MSIFAWVNSKIKRFDWLDIKLLKIGAFCLGLPVGAYFSEKILPYWWAFIILALLFHVRSWYKSFRK